MRHCVFFEFDDSESRDTQLGTNRTLQIACGVEAVNVRIEGRIDRFARKGREDEVAPG